jgi:hypothetical protein
MLPMTIVPTDEMTVEATSPHKRWNPPLAETLAMSDALLIGSGPAYEINQNKSSEAAFITFGGHSYRN